MKACLSIDLDDYGDYARLLGLHPGPTAQQTLYDDGLPRLLDVLDRHALRATFFAIGRDAAPSRHGARLRELMARGHEVANHSYDHPYDFRRLARAEKRREILDADKAIADATGRPSVTIRSESARSRPECPDASLTAVPPASRRASRLVPVPSPSSCSAAASATRPPWRRAAPAGEPRAGDPARVG